MIVYHEDEEGWNYQVNVETNKVIPGEFRFTSFAGSPAVEYTSGSYRGTRTFSSKSEVIERLTKLGFVEVDREPVGSNPPETPLSPEDTA
jgi:predicted secreted acid phosphatase